MSDGSVRKVPVILIIDDEDDILKLYSIWLGGLAIVRTANNGSDAWVSVKTIKPDLIIVDLLMPVVDGYIFLKMVNNDPTLSDIPVILNTGAFSEFGCMKQNFRCDSCDKASKGVCYAWKDSEELQKFVTVFLFKPVMRKQMLSHVKKILEIE